ncbi:CAP domain-containing protein [Chitinophaga arvensicola]|uniref:Cysteine-rich secretory protein family protein n=1 Tax=Chitinophaga arvensicola TaxID=29529 RepID=A0A1I0P9K3_9BACT|nr:CAP domain-containing protein [Chitinophaga arvensicola]SEW10244.1 Cysteine-rich secretory protein family protein [Chitinophaga arvensicola]
MPGKITRVATLLLAVLIYCSCTKTTDLGLKDPTKTPPPDTSVVPENSVDRKALLQLVNGLRSRGCNCGTDAMPAVGPVTWNGLLERAAYDHSKDMVLNKYFDHNGLNGSTPGTRLDAAGYKWNYYGENIASGSLDEQAVVLGWLNSPKHCHNMMNPTFTEIGIGRYNNDWTMELGKRVVTK